MFFVGPKMLSVVPDLNNIVAFINSVVTKKKLQKFYVPHSKFIQICFPHQYHPRIK